MISGNIHPEDYFHPSSGEARVFVSVADRAGIFHPFEFMVDTGFNGHLTLPLAAIEELGLSWFLRRPGELGDGEGRSFEIYRAVVDWNGNNRVASVARSETQPPLLGMAMLWGSRLIVEAREGGEVTIEDLAEV